MHKAHTNSNGTAGPGIRQRATLQTKVLLSITVLVTVVFVSAVAVALYFVNMDWKGELESRSQFIADLQADGLAQPLWNFELGQAEAMLRTLERDPDFRFAEITDSNGTVIATRGDPVASEKSVVTARQAIVHSETSEDELSTIQGTRLGELKLVLSQERLRDSLVQLAAISLLVLGLILFFVLQGVVRALRMMTTPLKGMVVAMEELAAGNSEVEIPALDRKDEIGHMAQAVQVFK
ncbi:MAG: HAMP domain-containing protein, partial [Proteobacteria bacterium]|nr:HAMP domain-containing protein [Pseudomonadota bacterium]